MKRVVLPPAAAMGVSNKGIRTYRETYKDLNVQKEAKKKLRIRLLKEQDFKCLYCLRDMHGLRANIEHITPVKQGGTNDVNNLAVACADCNKKKGNKVLRKHQRKELNRKRTELKKASKSKMQQFAVAKQLGREIEQDLGYQLREMFKEVMP